MATFLWAIIALTTIFYGCQTDSSEINPKEARDRWGNEFTQTEFQVGTDFGYAIYDPNNSPK